VIIAQGQIQARTGILRIHGQHPLKGQCSLVGFAAIQCRNADQIIKAHLAGTVELERLKQLIGLPAFIKASASRSNFSFASVSAGFWIYGSVRCHLLFTSCTYATPFAASISPGSSQHNDLAILIILTACPCFRNGPVKSSPAADRPDRAKSSRQTRFIPENTHIYPPDADSPDAPPMLLRHSDKARGNPS
jgi:hypothetical protein